MIISDIFDGVDLTAEDYQCVYACYSCKVMRCVHKAISKTVFILQDKILSIPMMASSFMLTQHLSVPQLGSLPLDLELSISIIPTLLMKLHSKN